jgi:hypothetical protein
MARTIKNLLRSKSGIKLDVGCGESTQKGWVRMDRRRLPGIDIVHDVQRFPWPLPAGCCSQILLSHLWEHIEPKHRMRLMDELWRICRADGQLWLVSPYAGSMGANQDPTHYSCPNAATFTYFDPKHSLYQVYKPKPWRLVNNAYLMQGNLEVVMEPVKK